MRYEELITCFSLVGSAHRNKGVAITIGVVGGAIAVVDRVSLANSHCRGDNRSSVNSDGGDRGDMAIALTHKTTSLSGHTPLDRVTHLPGHGVTPLHWHLDCDGEGDSGAGGDGLGGADSLWHLLGHGDTLGLGNLDTDSVCDIPADHGALLSGDLGALGHGDTVRNVDTVRLGDGPVYGDTDGHGDTMGHRHAGGNLDCLLSLHWHLPALTVNLLLTRPGWGGDKRDSESRVEAKRRRGDNRNAWKEELRVSFSIGLGLSLALSDPCSIKVGGRDSRDSSKDLLGGDLGLELG